MELPTPPPDVARAGLRALGTFALADGELRPIERDLLEAIQTHVLRSEVDLDALEPIEAAAVAEAVGDPAFRQRILYGCMLMTLIDGELDSADVRELGAWARALGVADRTLSTLRHHAEGHRLRLWWDVARRFVGGVRVERELREKGLGSLVTFALDVGRRGEDPALLARYAPLRDLPPGTLGREFVAFLDRNGFGLPGEKGAAPEVVLFHDCCHILTGYDTSPAGEAQMCGFHAGTHGEDPFGMLLFCAMQMHLGVQISPGAPGLEGWFQPDLVLAAFERGTRVPGDMMRDWDPRPHLARPVEELRAELNLSER